MQLTNLKKKYEDTRLGKSIGDTIDVFEETDKDALVGDFGSNLIASLIFPTTPSTTQTTSAMSPSSDMMLANPSTLQTTTIPKSISLNEQMLEAFFPKTAEYLEGGTKTAMKINDFIDKTPMILSLLRALGPTAYGQLTASKPYVDPYTMPTFRNPYRGGGY